MNRANTLCIWCMFAQVFPLFQETLSDGTQLFPWATLPKLYADGTLNGITAGGSANADPTMMTVVSVLALVTNIIALAYIIYVSVKRRKILTRTKCLQSSSIIRMRQRELRLNE